MARQVVVNTENSLASSQVMENSHVRIQLGGPESASSHRLSLACGTSVSNRRNGAVHRSGTGHDFVFLAHNIFDSYVSKVHPVERLSSATELWTLSGKPGFGGQVRRDQDSSKRRLVLDCRIDYRSIDHIQPARQPATCSGEGGG